MKTSSKLLLAVTFSAVVTASAPGHAGVICDQVFNVFGKLAHKTCHNVSDVVTPPLQKIPTTLKTIGKTAAAPLNEVGKVLLEGKSTQDALDDLVDQAKEGLRAAASIPTLTAGIENAAIGTVGDVLGTGAASVVVVMHMPTQVANQLPGVLVDKAIGASEGEAIGAEDIVAVPLDAMLRQAKTYYEPLAKPLPPQVRVLLEIGGHFSREQLDRVRYIVDDNAGNIAGLINLLQDKLGEATTTNHAVTIDNIIVFKNTPGAKGDLFFWAHEVQHTVQYSNMGIDEFASAYVKNYKNLEDDADRVANLVLTSAQDFIAALGS